MQNPPTANVVQSAPRPPSRARQRWHRGLLLAGVLMAAPPLATAGKIDVKVVDAAVVNDTIPDAVCPSGLARVGEKGLITVFSDGGDIAPGSKAYLVRSDDLGKTWDPPYKVLSSDDPAAGVAASLSALPNGKILLVEAVVTHHSGDLSPAAVFKSRSCAYNLKISSDGGQTFEPLGTLPSAPGAIGGLTDRVVELANGDLILPAYQYPGGSGKVDGYEYGCGYFRSTDGGKTWGRLEKAFADPIAGRTTPLDFNEAAYVVRPDGSILAYARIDSEISQPGHWQQAGNRMWYVESKNNGETWSEPQESKIGGIYPAILRLDDSRYLLVCGDRHASPTRKVTFYTSTDGLDFQPAGFAPYFRTNGECKSSGTGGAQSMVQLDKSTVYLVYYALDYALKTRECTYIEGCRLNVR
jgi:BNR repeat-like domain